MHYDPNYPTILPPLIALPLFLVLNILVPVSAYFIGRSFKRYKWVPHALAFLWVLASVFMFDLVGLPQLAPDEEGGPGEGFVLLPLVLETAVVLAIYFLALVGLLIGRFLGQNTTRSRSTS